MALDQITAGIITSAVRLAIALLIFWTYYKNKNKIAFYFGMFFLLFSAHGWFRTLSVVTGEAFWYFIHRVALTFGTVVILMALSTIGVEWIKKYKIALITAIASVLLAFNEAFNLGGVAAEQSNIIFLLPTFSIGGLGLIIAGYYFNSIGKSLPGLGKNLMVTGFVLEGLLNFAAVWLIPAGLTGLAFYLGLIFTVMIGIGWRLCLSREGI